MRYLIVALISLLPTVAFADNLVMIPWKGDYKHNSSRTWSRDNLWDSGFSKNFENGAPEEGGKVKKSGELRGTLLLPEKTTGPIPFVIVMHHCLGVADGIDVWAHDMANTFNPAGIGILILDSFATRGVHNVCGLPDLHWARRRADDAYSALDYLIEHKLALPDEVYVTGQSNGGTAALVAMSDKEADHKNKFAAGFPVAMSCINTPVRYGEYVRPMIMFGGDEDDANPVRYCVEMLKKKRSDAIQLIIYHKANHGFMFEYMYPQLIKGWVDTHGKEHDWHLSSNHHAKDDMTQTMLTAIKTKKFVSGIEYRN